jgi:hypothetical protein
MGMHRTHVVLPDKLVAEIDALVGQRRRSAFLAEVAEREVKRRRLLDLLTRKEPLWDPADHPEIDAAGGAAAWVGKMRREADRASRRRIRGSRG